MKKRTRAPGILALATLAGLMGLIGLTALLQPAPASADTAEFYLECPTTEVREGEDFDVYLVRVSDHQHDNTFSANWHTDAGTAGADDYVAQDSGQIVANDSESEANRAKRTFSTLDDALLEGNETFTVRFTPTDNVVDQDDPARDNRCEITILDNDPNITGLEIISEPARDNNTYGVGETIEIEATFSTSVDVNTSVEVEDNPGLGIQIGSNWWIAYYLRGSGSDTLVFGYTVQSGERDWNGIKIPGVDKGILSNWFNFLNHDAVTAAGTPIIAYQAYDGIDNQPDHKVNGSLTPIGTGMEIISEPEDGVKYRYGETILVALTLSAEVKVNGLKHLNARVGDGDDDWWRGVWYQSGTGTNHPDVRIYRPVQGPGPGRHHHPEKLRRGRRPEGLGRPWHHQGQGHRHLGTGKVHRAVQPVGPQAGRTALPEGNPHPLHPGGGGGYLRTGRGHPAQRELRPGRHRGPSHFPDPPHRVHHRPATYPLRLGQRHRHPGIRVHGGGG